MYRSWKIDAGNETAPAHDAHQKDYSQPPLCILFLIFYLILKDQTFLFYGNVHIFFFLQKKQMYKNITLHNHTNFLASGPNHSNPSPE